MTDLPQLTTDELWQDIAKSFPPELVGKMFILWQGKRRSLASIFYDVQQQLRHKRGIDTYSRKRVEYVPDYPLTLSDRANTTSDALNALCERASLTQSEMTLVTMERAGYTQSEIASALSVSQQTVSVWRAEIIRKLADSL